MDHLGNGAGDCYEAAFTLITECSFPLPAFLCHGAVTGYGPIEGVRYGHAWVELHGDANFLVLDHSNGRRMTVFGPVYYEAGQVNPEEVRRYTRTEALANFIMFETFGYWDPFFERFVYRND